ncbi:hypothetical protein EV363DRAFT_1398900 [Boletus edulis]|nr:hypothetical protein EV363DRAFT_1398900 [Boletus edulis]
MSGDFSYQMNPLVTLSSSGPIFWVIFAYVHIPCNLAFDVKTNSETTSDSDDFDLQDDLNSNIKDAHPPIQHIHMQSLCERLGPDVSEKIMAVLNYMHGSGLDLSVFLDLLSQALMISKKLPSIVTRWHQPPHSWTKQQKARNTEKNPDLCIDNQSHFDSGTASTVFFQPNAPPAPPLCNHTVQEYCTAGHKTPLTSYKIYNLAYLAALSQLLPTGPSYVTHQFMLGIEYLEEASYKGNINVINTILHQLKLDIENEMRPHDSQILDLDELHSNKKFQVSIGI